MRIPRREWLPAITVGLLVFTVAVGPADKCKETVPCGENIQCSGGTGPPNPPSGNPQAPPPATTSHYISSTSSGAMYNLGWDAAQNGEKGIIVLDFGQPWVSGGAYGTNLFDDPPTFVTLAQIRNLAVQFAAGYYDSSQTVLFQIGPVTIAIGTSNDQGSSGLSDSDYYQQGSQWAAMVKDAWSDVQGSEIAAAITSVNAGIDIEMDFNTPARTRAWVDGYDDYVGRRLYYNYGTASGCWTEGTNASDNGPCNDDWTQEDVWYVSYGQPSAFPLPEIYLNDGANAKQWQQLSLYGYLHHGGRMVIKGAMTQLGACQTVGCHPDEDNTPAQGWSQLYFWLRSDDRAWQNTLDWSTDITWE